MPQPAQPKITLREAREILGLSRKELAELARVSTYSVSSIENGKREYHINDGVAERLASALALTVNEIAWPKPLSILGRPAGTGIALTISVTFTAHEIGTNEMLCSSCFIIVRKTPDCESCGAATR